MADPLLHLGFGGEVRDPQGVEFADSDNLEIVGIFRDHKAALEAWRGARQGVPTRPTPKYVIVHLHRLLDPEKEEGEH